MADFTNQTSAAYSGSNRPNSLSGNSMSSMHANYDVTSGQFTYSSNPANHSSPCSCFARRRGFRPVLFCYFENYNTIHYNIFFIKLDKTVPKFKGKERFFVN